MGQLLEAARMWLATSPKYDEATGVSRAYGGFTYREFLLSLGFTDEDYKFFVEEWKKEIARHEGEIQEQTDVEEPQF